MVSSPDHIHAMSKSRAYICFDIDHDQDLHDLLEQQSRQHDSPFDIKDGSVHLHLTGDWLGTMCRRLSKVDLVIVVCGQHTDKAEGVAAELGIAREASKPYFLLGGRTEKTCTRPASALATDTIYKWTWDNLKALTAGER